MNFLNLLGEISEVERAVLLSAVKKNGVFCKRCDVFGDRSGVILFDGNFLYPIGEIRTSKHIKLVEKIAWSGVLGAPKNVRKILKSAHNKNWITMKKDFAVLERNEHLHNDLLPDDIRIHLIKNKDELREFCNLKTKFLFEESGQIVDSKNLHASLKDCYLNFNPALLSYKDETVGMISSNFSSDEVSMINMLFIEKKFRRYGYGRVLLKWYIRHLFKSSRNICLYFSPENVAANKIYKKIGFEITDELLMAIQDDA